MKDRDLIKLIEADGWVVERVAGSHMQSRHLSEPGTVTVPAGGHLAKYIPPGTLNINPARKNVGSTSQIALRGGSFPRSSLSSHSEAW